jgi:hypothetical protein
MKLFVGFTVGIPDTVMGLTFVAAGVSVPDALSSLAVIKEGILLFVLVYIQIYILTSYFWRESERVKTCV